MKHRYLLLAAGLWTFTGCSDSGPTFFGGSLSFSYSGVVNGTFDAEGSALDADDPTKSWALGVRDDAQQAVGIVASMPQPGNLHDFVALTIPRVTSGSATVDVNCTASVCASALFGFRTDESNESQFLCGLESGTLTITAISASRATGTFSGSGTCLDNAQNETSFSVTAGTFDVSLVSGGGAG